MKRYKALCSLAVVCQQQPDRPLPLLLLGWSSMMTINGRPLPPPKLLGAGPRLLSFCCSSRLPSEPKTSSMPLPSFADVSW